MTDSPVIVAFPQDGRPPPPKQLTPAEAETWRAVVGSRPVGYFGPEVHAVLSSYVMTAMLCDDIGAQLRVTKGVDHALLETYDRMTRLLMDLATALCLLPARPAGA
jgi:hypothetical protein